VAARQQQLEVVHEAPPPAVARTMTPMEMLNTALERGDGIDKLERLMDLNDRWDKAEAKKAFLEAKAAFKANAPDVLRDKENKQYKSHYASIGNLVNTVNEALSKHGFDASWLYEQTDTSIKTTCTLKHVRGHSESVTLAGPPDVSGAKNPLQQIKSTTTYLRIATFEAVTGIATKEGNADDDGNGAGKATADCNEPIGPAQLEELLKLADDVGADKARFCKLVEIESFKDITVGNFAKAKSLLEAKRKK
jgi:hypothetical protein